MRLFSSGKSPRAVNPLQMQFRSMQGATADYSPTVEKVATFVEAASKVLPARDVKPWLIRPAPLEPSLSNVKTIAANFREIIGLDDNSPATDLSHRLEYQEGLIVSVLRDSRFEGVSLSSGNYLYIFVSPRFKARMLFTLAHEIGHVLAGHVQDDAPLFEGASDIGNFRKSTKNERFVDAIAGSILLPDNGIFDFISSIRVHLNISSSSPLGDVEILLLARFFGVSFEVAGKRCEDVGLLPSGGAFAMAAELRKNHGSPERRADELGLPARSDIFFPSTSKVLRDAVNSAIEVGAESVGWAADSFGFSISEILSGHRSGRSL